MRRLARWMGRLVALLALCLVVGMLLPRPLFRQTIASEVPTRAIVVLSSAIHTDIAIPLDDRMRADFAFLLADGVPVDNPNAAWLVIGWGGRDFYMNTPALSQIKLKPLLKALTIDTSVMRFDVARSIPADRFGVTRFAVGDRGLRNLAAYVKASLLDVEGRPAVVPGPGYGDFDRFYEAKGYFNVLVGCNTWTATALRSAGLRTGWWTPLPQTLDLSLSMLN